MGRKYTYNVRTKDVSAVNSRVTYQEIVLTESHAKFKDVNAHNTLRYMCTYSKEYVAPRYDKSENEWKVQACGI